MEIGQRVYGITETARILDLSAEWLRQGERRGSLPKAKRNRNGHRYYSDQDIAHLRNRRLLRVSE